MIKLFVVLALIMLSYETLARHSGGEVYFRNIAHVTLEANENTCSEIRISYWPLARENSRIPLGVLGNGVEGFTESVLILRPSDNSALIPMAQDFKKDLRTAAGEISYGIFNDGIETVVTIDLGKYFNLNSKEYFLVYSYKWLDQQNGLDYFYNILTSQRYFLTIDDDLCISSFK